MPVWPKLGWSIQCLQARTQSAAAVVWIVVLLRGVQATISCSDPSSPASVLRMEGQVGLLTGAVEMIGTNA